MPIVLSVEEVERLIASAGNLMHRTMLMMLYATGLRRAELSHLKVSDVDSERMVVHVRQGKGGRDRDVLLSPKLLETLREAANISVPRYGQQLASRRAHYGEDHLDCRGRSCEASRHREACVPSYAAP
jgi:integrase